MLIAKFRCRVCEKTAWSIFSLRDEEEDEEVEQIQIADMEALKTTLEELSAKIKELEQKQNSTTATEIKIATTIPLPKPINITEGNVKTNFKFFATQWKEYLTASGLGSSNEAVKKATLLSAIGEECLRVYENLPLTEDEKKSESTLLAALEKHLAPSVNVRYERAMFNQAKQGDDESYDVYINRLRALVKTCDYGTMQDDLFLDKIICSVKSIKLREQLWNDTKITLADAINKCKSKELVLKQMKEIADAQVTKSEEEVNRFRDSRRRTKFPQENCKFCGGKHEKNKQKCPACKAKCDKCGKSNHFAKVCVSGNTERNSTKTRTVKTLQDDDSEWSDSDSDNFVLKIESNRKGMRAAIEICTSNGEFVKTPCILDTGASCNVVGRENLRTIFGDRQIIARPTKTRLKSFGGAIIEPVGKTFVVCRRKAKLFRLKFEIVEHDQIPLLSANACTEMGYIEVCESISTLNTAKDEAKKIVEEFSNIFDGLGQFEGEISLEVKEDAIPVIQKPRRIAVALNDELKQQLDEMEKLGVICKESGHTDWVSNILVAKKNNKMRICLDPCALNKALKSVNYMIPTIEEILPELSNAKVFSTVDAKKGFWQVKLDDASSKLCTFFTPYGRYRFVRMPFGISPAMEIYQMKQNEILNGLKGIAVLADDVLIYGCGETIEEAVLDHNRKLRK